MKPKISYITITARPDYPTVGLPGLHLWTPTLETLKKQTLQEFEYIIVDVFYEERKDYFKHSHGLRIKHIPAAPNIWYKYGVVQTCHQFNKGVIHADGELLFFDADSSLLPADLMANLWRHYQDEWFVSLGFGADLTYAPNIDTYGNQPVDINHNMPLFYDYGYKGHVTMDHRYKQLFQDGKVPVYGGNGVVSLSFAPIPASWYYGISTVSLEAALKVNGFNLAFDGDPALNDVDFGERLVRAGYPKLAMFKDSFVIEAYAGVAWHPKMRTPRSEIKCNYGMLLYNRLTDVYRANEITVEPELIIKQVCNDKCDIKETCQKSCSYRAPFYNKNEKKLYEYWKKYAATERQDLVIEREMRLAGDDYTEGTFVNV
jgi:GT2 family glycosyltransferase